MWESPIDTIYKDITEQFEGAVFKAIQEVGITVDRDELLKALSYDRGQYEKGYADGKADAVRYGRWEITDAYPHNIHCGICHKRFAQTHWQVWEDGTLPRNYCPNCGTYMVNENE